MLEKVAQCSGTRGARGSQCGLLRHSQVHMAPGGQIRDCGGHPGTPESGEGQELGLPVQARKSSPEGVWVAVALQGGDSFSASLCSQVPPSIREDGRRANLSGMAGQSLTLECDANGFPAPEIVWFKDGQPVGVLWRGWAVGGIWIGYGPSGWVPACAGCGKEM